MGWVHCVQNTHCHSEVQRPAVEALPSTTWVSKLVLGVDIQRADGEGGQQVVLWVEGVVRGFNGPGGCDIPFCAHATGQSSVTSSHLRAGRRAV